MTKPHPPFAEQLRQAIRDSKQTQLGISRKTGVQQAVLSRFLSGRAGMSLASVGKIVEHLGLTLHGHATEGE